MTNPYYDNGEFGQYKDDPRWTLDQLRRQRDSGVIAKTWTITLELPAGVNSGLVPLWPGEWYLGSPGFLTKHAKFAENAPEWAYVTFTAGDLPTKLRFHPDGQPGAFQTFDPVPGDPLMDTLNRRPLKIRHPWALSFDHQRSFGNNEEFGEDKGVQFVDFTSTGVLIVGPDPVPTGVNDGINVSGLKEITFSLGAHALTNVDYYAVEIYAKYGYTGWAKIYERNVSSAWSDTLPLNGESRLFFRIAEINPTGLGAGQISKYFGTLGEVVSGMRGIIQATAWYPREDNLCR